MTKEEIIAVVQKCAAELGHAPAAAEFRRLTNVTKNEIRKNFGTHTRMLFASGVERRGCGYLVTLHSLFLDWAGVARKIGKVPAMTDYELHGKYSVRPLTRRYSGWKAVAAGMLDYATKQGLEGEWKDVMEIVEAHMGRKDRPARTSAQTMAQVSSGMLLSANLLPPMLLPDRPVYGQPMYAPFSYAPTNEQGVMFVFGSVAAELGFSMMRIQSEFPDCEAMRQVAPNRCQWVKIEVEYESRNFLMHKHPLDGCDLIVCWINNWPECPLEVIELREVLRRSGNRDIEESPKSEKTKK